MISIYFLGKFQGDYNYQDAITILRKNKDAEGFAPYLYSEWFQEIRDAFETFELFCQLYGVEMPYIWEDCLEDTEIELSQLRLYGVEFYGED